jgi:LacI family transcriptional regulator
MADGAAKERDGRVTIRTVAADAGVSVAAVSKVLRNAYGVSDALRLKVEASIAKLGYRPSVAARGMRGQTYTIGVLLVEIGNPFLPSVIDGINTVLEPSNYKALLGVGRSKASIESSLIESMIDNRMDGLILIAPRMAGPTLEAFARQIPIVAVAHHEPSHDFDTINTDDRLGGQRATEALIAAGHRDIAMISYVSDSDQTTNVTYERQIGYGIAMQAAGLADHARILRFGVPEGDRSADVQRFMAMPDRPRAIFVWSDLDAIPILNAAKMSGVRVPEDLAIIGYDNSPVAALPLIGLASMDQNPLRLGALAMQTLLSRIGGRKVAEHLSIAPTLAGRGSL